MRHHLAFFALGAMLLGATAAQAADISVEIPNVKNATGNLRIGVWSSPDTFLEDETAVLGLIVAAEEGLNKVLLSNLKPGVYAISLFHDEDKNDDLNANILGIPTEGYGFSNNARGTFGPPSFKDAEFTLGDSDLQMEISLIY